MVEDSSLYQIQFSRKAQKNIRELTEQQKRKLKVREATSASASLITLLKQILEEEVRINPFNGKALKGKLKGLYSLRLNRKDRI